MAATNGDGLDQSLEDEKKIGNDDRVTSQKSVEKSVENLKDQDGDRIASKDLSREALGNEQPRFPFLGLYTFADKYDCMLMFFGTISSIVHGACLPVLCFFFGDFLNAIGGDPANILNAVDKYALYFEWCGVACLASTWIEVSFWMQTGENQSARLRVNYLQALLRQDISYFDTDTSTGDFVSSISSNPLLVQDAISEKSGSFIHHISTFLVSNILAFYVQWRIALLTLAIFPPIALVVATYVYYLTSITAEGESAYSEAASLAEQAISQVRTVYSYVGEARFVKYYSDALQKTMKIGTKAGLAKGIGMGATVATIILSYAALFFAGGVVIRGGHTNGAVALSTIFNVMIGSISLGQTVPSIAAFAKARVAAFKIFQMMKHEPTINRSDESTYELKTLKGHIELCNVGFSYPSRPDALVLHNFSLIIPAGQTLAIAGSSGSGKSTVVSLIERFYDPNEGQVLLDGHGLKELDLKWLRRQIGLVNQEPSLFAMTVAENIMYGTDHASQEEIEDAAKLANIHSLIRKLPLGYQTQVGERGLKLSGGQRQRIAIARAMVRKPRVLLLDEATSALDAGSEQVVQEALDRIVVGRTTVVVAHRLSTIRNADIIAVLQQGRMVESGTHDDLISKEDGAYSALVRMQQFAITTEDELQGSPFSAAHLWKSPAGSPCAGGPVSLSTCHTTSTVDAVEIGEATGPSERKEDFVKLSKGSSMIRLVAMAKEDWIYGIMGILGSMGSGCVYPIIAILMGQLLSVYYRTDHESMKKGVALYSLIYVGIGIVAGLLHIVQDYPLGVMGGRLMKRVREKMFATILRNEMGWFDEDDNNSSEVAARLASDAANVRVAFEDSISVIVKNCTMLLLSFGLALMLQWKLGLVTICVFPMVTFSFLAEADFVKCSMILLTSFLGVVNEIAFMDPGVYNLLTRSPILPGFCVVFAKCRQSVHFILLLGGFAEARDKSYAKASQVAGEAVSNIRTTAAFDSAGRTEALYAKELEIPAKQSFQRGQIVGFGYGLAQCLSFSADALVLWYGGVLVHRGEATFAEAAKIFLILVTCASATADTLALTPALARGRQAVASMFRVLDRVTKIEPDDNEAEKVDKIRGDIELRDVTMAYPLRPDVVVLRNLNLKVLSGHTLALAGASGSGKTSVISLIERYYDPLSGEILIDGMDIKQYNLKSLRQHIAMVQQEPALFATTIYENILYGREGASMVEVIEAAEAANAHKFISALPDGYKTQVGERGVQLSGGQKQRVAIARAVLKDPAIFLLDEATSALDTQSEKTVQEALDKLMNGRTTIIVAHRLSTIRSADSIAVLQDGSIVEEGSHSDLVSKGGRYAHLIDLQNRVREAQSRCPGTD